MTSETPSNGSASSSQPRPVAWRGVIPAFVTTTAGMLPGFLLAGFAVQIRNDIGLSLTSLGVLIGTFFGVAAAVSPTMGRLSERAGWATGLRLAALMTAVSLAGVGWVAESTVTIAAFFIIGGVASALGQIASNLTVARCVHPRRQGLVFGLRHAAVPAAALLAGLAVPTIALTVGWRWGFRGGVLLAIVAAISIPRNEQPHIVNPPRPRLDGGSPRPATPMRLLVLLSVAVGLGTGGVDTVASFIVSYAVHEGVGEDNAGFLLALGSLLGVAARVIAGWLIDRISHSDLTAVAAMISTGAIGVVLLNVGGTPGFYAGALLAFAAGWGWAGLFTFAVVKDNPEAPAVASGVTQTGKYIGAALGPPIFGMLADRVSFTAAWWFTASALATAASLMIYVRNRRPQ
jgi:cyanate permease